MNYVILIGRLGDKPKIVKTEKGKVAKFSLATNEYYKNSKGEYVTETESHNIVFWQFTDFIEKNVEKGDMVLVQGKIITRNYKDKQGEQHWSTEIVGQKIELIKKVVADEPEEEEVF